MSPLSGMLPATSDCLGPVTAEGVGVSWTSTDEGSNNNNNNK